MAGTENMKTNLEMVSSLKEHHSISRQIQQHVRNALMGPNQWVTSGHIKGHPNNLGEELIWKIFQ